MYRGFGRTFPGSRPSAGGNGKHVKAVSIYDRDKKHTRKGNIMTNNPERCHQLHTLHDHLTSQVKALREGAQRAEQEGVGTSIESLNTIKSLQSALHTISLELQKCPPQETQKATASAIVRQAKATLPEQRVRNWFPDAVQNDNDSESILGDL
jgi:hypothetical protein